MNRVTPCWLPSDLISQFAREKCLFIKFVVKVAACLAITCTLASISPAQQTSPAGSDSSAQTQPQDAGNPAPEQAKPQQPADPVKESQEAGEGKVAGTSNDRLFYTLPNFLSVQNQQLPPLSIKDKFKVVALGNFDYIQYPWWAIISAISQAENNEPQFGQGWAAYGKRYGTTAGDSTVENFMVGAVFPSILRQDPRFYYSEEGTIPHRIDYAITRMVITRSDSGRTQPNYSEIFGAATAAVVSDYTYHPKSTYVNGQFVPSDRTISNTASVFGTQLGLDTITYVVKEFWPDIHRKMSHKHTPYTASAH